MMVVPQLNTPLWLQTLHRRIRLLLWQAMILSKDKESNWDLLLASQGEIIKGKQYSAIF